MTKTESPPAHITGRRLVFAIVLLALGCFVFNVFRDRDPVQKPAASPADLDRDETTLVQNSTEHPAGFVGPQACAECHAERVAEVAKTNHFRTCRVPITGEVAPGFAAGQGQHASSHAGLRFEMSEKDGEFFHTTILSPPMGNSRKTARIDLILGAGSADDIHLSWNKDGKIIELPMAWLWTSSQWGTSHFDPHSMGHFSRPSTPRCLECHNTWMDFVAGSTNQYRRNHLLLGVTCERCHGPGREHVDFHTAHPKDRQGRSIVNPAELSRESQIEVCTQCHSNAVLYRAAPFTHRPGDPVEKSYRTISTQHTEEDHVANQIDYLRESKCFQNSKSMTCVTCHNPHRPRGPKNAGSFSCVKCHRPEHCTDQDSLPPAVRDKCVECHMPKYVKINVNFRTADDDFVPPIMRYEHRIAIHRTARQEVLLNWYRSQTDVESGEQASQLTESLVDYWLREAEECDRQYRYLGAIAAIREALRIETTPATLEKLRLAVAKQVGIEHAWHEAGHQMAKNQMHEAIDTFNRILKLKPDEAPAHGKIGTLYASIGKKDLAREHLALVAKYDQDNLSGHAMLGWIEYIEDRPAEALKHFSKAEEVEPFQAKIQYQTGLALAKLDRLTDAVKHFEKALKINPNHLEACQGMVAALRRLNKPEQAIPFAQQAAGLTENRNIDLLMTLAETFAEAGQFANAYDTATIALKVVESTQRSAGSLIRERMTYYLKRANQQTEK